MASIKLVTKDYKIVPLTNLLRLLLAGRVMGGGEVSVLLGSCKCSSEKHIRRKKQCNGWVGVKGECA